MQLSLIDRLSADVLNERRSYSASRQFDILKSLIRRDLTALLNTKRAEYFDTHYEQAANSFLVFGVVDFTSYNLNSAPDQERVRFSMERAIRQFEPRLTRVRVWFDAPDAVHPVLRFQIEALLRIDDMAETVLFDAKLQRDTRRILVSGAD
jgi:type VI secretion system protein ImpF